MPQLTKSIAVGTPADYLLMVALIEPDNSAAVWSVEVRAQVGGEFVRVGAPITTKAPAVSGLSGRRLVAIGDLPSGEWQVVATPTPPEASAELLLSLAPGQIDGGPLVNVENPSSGPSPTPGPGDQADTILWVAPNGNDSTAVKGNMSASYGTLQGALDAMEEGDIISVAAGTYTGNLVLPVNKNVTIIGADPSTVTLTAEAGDVVTWNPEFAFDNTRAAKIVGVTIASENDRAILAYQSPSDPYNASLTLENCTLNGGRSAPDAGISRLGLVEMRGCRGRTLLGRGVVLADIGLARILDPIDGAFDVSVSTPTSSTFAHDGYTFRGGKLTGLRTTGRAKTYVDQGTVVTSTIAEELTESGEYGEVAQLVFRGQGDSVSVDVPNVVEDFLCVLDGSNLVALEATYDEGAGPRTISARGSTIVNVNLDSSSGQVLTVDIRGGGPIDFVQSTFGGNVCVDRDGGAVKGKNITTAMGTNFSFDWVSAPSNGVILEPPYPPGASVVWWCNDSRVTVNGSATGATASAAATVGGVDLAWQRCSS